MGAKNFDQYREIARRVGRNEYVHESDRRDYENFKNQVGYEARLLREEENDARKSLEKKSGLF